MRTLRFLHNVAFGVRVCVVYWHVSARGVIVFWQNDMHLTVSSQNSLGRFNKIGSGSVSGIFHHPTASRDITFIATTVPLVSSDSPVLDVGGCND